MTKLERKYIRVYCDDLAKDYPELWNDANLGWTWLRLLDVAERMWPSIAEVPRWVKPRVLNRLVELGIVTLVFPYGFRLKGLDAERARRQAHAKKGAAGRWGDDTSNAQGNAPGTADGNAGAKSLDETPQDTTSRDERGRATDDPFAQPEFEALQWLSKHGCDIRPGNGWHQKLVLAVEHHGVNAFVGMLDRLAEAGTRDGDMKGFLFGAIDALDSRTRPNLAEVEREEREEERAAARRNRRVDPAVAEFAAYLREQEAAEAS